MPNAFPEYFDFKSMHLPEATRACEHEAVWLDGAVFRAGPKGIDDAVAAIKKIQKNAKELSDAADELSEDVRKLKPMKNKFPELRAELIIVVINFGSFCNPSAKCVECISSPPVRSAIVRINFRIR
ncbi:MAG: hypothetical protein MZU91_06480 [Desulfosudis oleivorans]|nr:hypothetical protein [Desulfosudis oleivorans]